MRGGPASKRRETRARAGAHGDAALRLVDPQQQWLQGAYAEHGAELYRFALRSLGDRGLAEEAVQDTFLRAWRASERFDARVGSLRTWLFAILRNRIIDLGRARAVRPPLAGGGAETDAEPVGAATTAALDNALLAWHVEEALRRLRDDHRVALVEIHVRGRPYQEVADELGVPAGTMKSRVYYALKALRLTLEEMGLDEMGLAG
ncbi:MAG: sigma-70 family RNA polymerase sigma factor [Acidimicrobiales bacterium]